MLIQKLKYGWIIRIIKFFLEYKISIFSIFNFGILMKMRKYWLTLDQSPRLSSPLRCNCNSIIFISLTEVWTVRGTLMFEKNTKPYGAMPWTFSEFDFFSPSDRLLIDEWQPSKNLSIFYDNDRVWICMPKIRCEIWHETQISIRGRVLSSNLKSGDESEIAGSRRSILI